MYPWSQETARPRRPTRTLTRTELVPFKSVPEGVLWFIGHSIRVLWEGKHSFRYVGRFELIYLQNMGGMERNETCIHFKHDNKSDILILISLFSFIFIK